MANRNRLLPFIFCLCVAAAFGQPRGAAADYLKQGHALYGKGRLDEAVAAYDKAIAQRPTHASAYLHRGHARRAQGALDSAIDDYERAAALDPRSTRDDSRVAQAFINRGAIRKGKLEIENAIRDLNRAIEVCPRELQAYLERGQARILKEDFAGAVADFDHLIGSKGGDPARIMFAYADRGFVNLLLGRKEEAERDFNESLKRWEKNRLWLDSHLKDLEMQLLLMRELRKRNRKDAT